MSAVEELQEREIARLSAEISRLTRELEQANLRADALQVRLDKLLSEGSLALEAAERRADVALEQAAQIALRKRIHDAKAGFAFVPDFAHDITDDIRALQRDPDAARKVMEDAETLRWIETAAPMTVKNWRAICAAMRKEGTR